ncbi:MAG: NAD(P)H-quinone oxidoreductase [Gammaproteobacteria bacterium]|nr:NAD(P)H-quinone oxidoreductase [Gammaproteobacteria bacterium]MXY63761.1 NAD(P)H-quinone oxidoreductase [Gammaproteobacteria bacterium]MYG65939.1 NAD(P)H-quinone oxidoreductase [Gammaproteobacteria bacterium]
MKAILLDGFGGPECMHYGEARMPEPGANQVLIRVAATSVNRPDIIQRQGNYNPPQGESEILGLEVAGTVESVGEDVTDWKRGDRVMALIGGGGYAEFAVAHAGHLMTIPENMTFAQAACVCETYITAFLNLFRLGRLKDGESALLHGGGGGVNTAAIQLCRQLAPESPLFVTASSGKVDSVRELGAQHVIDYRHSAFDEEIAEITGGRGVDVILDHVGAEYLQKNLKSLAVYGRLVIIGVTSGPRGEINLALMMVKRQQITGSVLRPRSIAQKAEIIRDFRDRVLGLFASGAIAPLVSHEFPLQEAASAHRLMETSGHFGKIVLNI